jgi:hypothetical protein
MKTTKTTTAAFLIATAFISSGCTKSESTTTEVAEVQKSFDYAAYDGPNNISDFDGKYNNHCTTSLCLLEDSPSNIPIKKHDGTSICAIPQYESKALLTAYFSRDGNFIGAGCQISALDYNNISSHYGTNKTYNRYLDQRGVFEDFKNWKTSNGFITTYKELIGRGKDGGVVYVYNLYVGNNEHPRYSEYVKP